MVGRINETQSSGVGQSPEKTEDDQISVPKQIPDSSNPTKDSVDIRSRSIINDDFDWWRDELPTYMKPDPSSENPLSQKRSPRYYLEIGRNYDFIKNISVDKRTMGDYALCMLHGKDAEEHLQTTDQSGLEKFLDFGKSRKEQYVKEWSKSKKMLAVLDDDDKSRGLCLLFCKKDINCLGMVPDSFKDSDFYMALCHEDGNNLKYVPESERNMDICLTALKQEKKAWESIPEEYKAICGLAYGFFNKELCEFENGKEFLEASPAIRNDILLKMAILEPNTFNEVAKKLSLDQSVIDDILNKRNNGVSIPEIPVKTTENPLKLSVQNPHLLSLADACFRNQQHPFSVKGIVPLVDWIEEKKTECRFSQLNKELSYSFDDAEVVGGRTCRVDGDGRSYHYKFQRVGKGDDQSLIKEYLVNQYYSDNQEKIGLESEIPKSEQLFKIPLSQLPESLRDQFTDRLEIIKEGEEEFVQGYCYSTASHDYCSYVQTADNPADKKKAQEGMRKAIRDLARANKPDDQGCLAYTSLVPGYHGGMKRRWFTFSSLIDVPDGFHYSGRLAGSGRFSNWCGDATGHADVGFSGKRDNGDFEPAGSISSYDEQRNNKKEDRGYPETVKQSLYFLNSIADNFIGMTLLYARSERYEPGYNADNSKAVKAVSDFLEQMFEDYLGVYTGKPVKLRDFLSLDEHSYSQLLKRIAFECLYWTSVQYYENLPESKRNKITPDHPRPGFMKDIAVFGLDPGYYPIPENGEVKPSDFFGNGETFKLSNDVKWNTEHLSLGANSRAMPLLSLQRMITLFCAKLIDV